MKKIIGTIVIAMLLMMPMLLMIPVQVIAQPTMKLSDAIGGGTGGTFYLSPNTLYYADDDVTISGNTWIYGNGAMIDMDGNSIVITGKYLYIERCTIANAYYGLDFEDDASGFVYNNIIVNSEDGIYIDDCDKYEIIIKENSILYSSDTGIEFYDSTGITILENIIKNNDYGIYGINEYLMVDSDWLPEVNELHNILIKGNDIGVNYNENIYLEYVNGVSIASNLVYSNAYESGIELYYCPVVSITYNKILANYDNGIYYEGDTDWPLVDTDGVGGDDTEVLLSLTISYNKIMGNYYYGMEIYYTQNVVITYNEIVGNDDAAIYLEGDDQDFLMMPILIAYNTIIGNYNDGIYLEDYVSDVSILFNKIVGNAEDGIYAYAYNDGEGYGENLLIKGNVITGNEDEGMYIEYWYAPVTIEWNTVLGNEYEVYLYDLENPQIIHNTIMYTYSGEEGIDMEYCEEGGRIAYNTIAYNTDNGIEIEDSDGVIVEHNTIIGSGADGTTTEGDGINVSDSDDITVQYNTIHNNYDDGVEFYDSSGLIANNIIGHTDGNLISGQWYGIYINDCDSPDELVTISDNIIIGNYEGIDIYSSDPIIVRNYIANNVYGIYLYDYSDPIIGGSYDNRNFIIRNYLDGIYISDVNSEPVITYNNIYWNVEFGVNVNAADSTIDATYNWWGAMDGPGGDGPVTPGGIGPGHGDEVIAPVEAVGPPTTYYIDYIPWLTAIIP
ncbi:MAG: right-handed parallel beta-helix repeat-containing protein [archaeon]|nr:right-handed parallel beta-helix repeat-containing protein [archaeon]